MEKEMMTAKELQRLLSKAQRSNKSVFFTTAGGKTCLLLAISENEMAIVQDGQPTSKSMIVATSLYLPQIKQTIIK